MKRLLIFFYFVTSNVFAGGYVPGSDWDPKYGSMSDYDVEIDNLKKMCKTSFDVSSNIGRLCTSTKKTEAITEANKICMKYQSILFEPSLAFKFTVALEKDFYTFSCEASMLQSLASTEIKTNTKKFKSLDIGKAKQECIRLGYKEKTEKFGNCVLELTK